MRINAKSVHNDTSHILEFPKTHDQRYDQIIDSGLSKNPRQSLAKAIELIDEGYARANTLVGWIYEVGGDGVPRDPSKAAFYYKRATVEVGDEVAWWGLARLNFHGRGMPQNYEEAFRCYSIVANEANNPMAWLMLGWMYLDGKGTKPNLIRARECLNKAAEADYIFAYTFLGHLERRLKRRWKALGYFGKALWKSFFVSNRDPRFKLD